MRRWRNMLSAFGRGLRRSSERGSSESVEFIFFVPPLVLLVTLITIAASVRAAQVSLWSASRECARAASSTTNRARGAALGARIAASSLDASGIKLANTKVDVSHPGAPGGYASCTVQYKVDISMLPMARLLKPLDTIGNVFVLSSSYALQIETYRSRE
jgi:Flp pilus assembly protein TadG